MKHSSIPLNSPIEFLNIEETNNPLISKCQIKVCYVGEEPNRNGSIITKETARQMAPSLRGCPIVGFYNEAKGDFEEHNRQIEISNGEWKFKDTTIPYGFVDMNAKIWFQKFLDDGQVEREYLVTEGWIWTDVFPETQRIFVSGNNHSMELDEKRINAEWTEDENGMPQFFIINEAFIRKLCILGEECEPCFEGAQITKVQFSFSEDFEARVFTMLSELKDLINQKEGGAKVFETYEINIGSPLWNSLYEIADNAGASIVGVYTEGEQKFAVVSKEDKYYRLNFSISNEEDFAAEELVEMTDYTADAEPQFAEADVAAYAAEYVKKKDEKDKDDDSDSEDKKEEEDSDSDSGDDKDEDDDKDKKKKKYSYDSLDEISEYVELQNSYAELQAENAQLNETISQLNEQLASLNTFKAKTERAEKEELIKGFYMLSDEDKKDVMDNIDTYSLNDIEAKLSVICFRKKVNFADNSGGSLSGAQVHLDALDNHQHTEDLPDWINAVLETENSLH